MQAPVQRSKDPREAGDGRSWGPDCSAVCSRRVVPAATPAVCLTLGACRNTVACAIALRVTPLHGQGGFGTEKCPAEVPARDRAGIGGWEGRPPADQTQEGGKERRPRETFSWTLTLASPG